MALTSNVQLVPIEVADGRLRELLPDHADRFPPRAQAQQLSIPSSVSGGSVTCAASPGPVQPIEIVTLAASLKCDPDLIFEYVYNNIEFEPIFGSNKGPLGTLLDQRGSDIDQAQLLTSLWSAAGVSANPAHFVYGYIHLTGAQAPNWLGTINNAQGVSNALAQGGIPATVYKNGDGSVAYVDVAHVWVQVSLNGSSYVFDPSFKQHTSASIRADLASVMGYGQTSFLQAAGGTVNALSITGISRPNVRGLLTGYANNIVAYIQHNASGQSLASFLGQRNPIISLTGSPLRQTALPNLTTPQPAGYPADWGTSVPAAYRTCFTVSMPGVAADSCSNPSPNPQTILLYADQTYGHRITIFSIPNGSLLTPTLLIDGAPPPNGQNTGTSSASGQPWSVNIGIVHPAASPAIASLANQSGTLTIKAGGSYLVSSGWGQVSQGMIAKHRALLAQAMAAGNGGASEIVLGETLAVISYSWLAENASMQRILNSINGTTTQYYHGLGITAQTSIQGQSGTQGPYVDLPLNYVGVTSQSASGSGSFSPLEVATFLTDSGVSSSLESAVLEQTQGLFPGMTAASTIRLVDQNVQAGATTYFADGTTAAGVSAYFNSIRGNLSYSSADLAVIDNLVSTNGTSTGSPTNNRILLPANGMQNVGLWTGAGYTVVNSTSTSISVAQKISGGLSGGFSGTDVPTTSLTPNAPNIGVSSFLQTASPTANLMIPSEAVVQEHAPNNSLISEPVDAITGAYLYNNTDLVVGNGPLPYALPFGRTYSSAANMNDLGLGKGWSHSFSFSAMRGSNPYAGFGEGSLTQAASAIAALYVMQDLLNQPTPTVQNLTLAWVTARWLTDQLTNNSVIVSQPGTNEGFIAAPRSDGAPTVSYAAPAGSGAVLTGSAPDANGLPTVFSYVAKDKRVITFNPVDVTNTGSIAGFSIPAGVSLTFAYGYTYNGLNYLTQVSSNLGRAIALTWSGPHITSAYDGLGRSVSYSYDTNGNLIGETDPLGKVMSYGYDGQSHLTNIYYPTQPSLAFVTNSYDGLGRVSGQANANGASTTFYFAGARTEMIDPAGDRHVTYQTPSGKVVTDIGILSATIGDVFNDTPQQSGLVIARNLYDGQDRLTLATNPEGGTTAYAYSPDFQQNLTQLTINPKPGSSLVPLTTTYTYDPVFNKPITITDPRGLVTSMSYDANGNLTQMVRDAGAAPHLNSTSRFTYDSHGLLLSSLDPLHVLTQYAYDIPTGNLVAVVRDANGLRQASSQTYDLVGNALTQTDANLHVTASSYDASRRRVSVTAPSASGQAPVVTNTAYDANGNPIATQQQSVGGAVLRTTLQTYTATGKVATSTDPNGGVTKYAYDGVDRLTSVRDAMGRVTLYGYDALSRRTSVSNPAIPGVLLQSTTFTPDGLMASLTDANGNVLAYAYDGLDRLATTTYPATGTVGATTEALTYDADSNVQTRTTRKGDVISFGYDTLNRLITKTEPSGTPSVSYAYDLAGRVTSVSDTGASIAAVSQTAGLQTLAAYDALNRVVAVVWLGVAGQVLPAGSGSVVFNHSYDATNLRVGQAVNDNNWLAYPGPTNSTAYTVNALNQYATVGSVTPTYDANGNLTFDGTFTYGYDAESRLVSIAQGGTAVASYAYDGRGRRKSRTVGGTTTIYATGAEDQEVVEYDGATGAVGAFYTYNLGGGLDDVLNRVVNGGGRQTLVADIQGSIIAGLDSGGALTKVAYQWFGESADAVSSGGGLRYTGRRLDPETAVAGGAQTSGLYYYRARTYSPVLGRFLQPDPIGIAGGVNLYAYVGNSPLNATDPNGLAADYLRNQASGLFNLLPPADPNQYAAVGAGAVGLAGAGIGSFYGGIGGGVGGGVGGTLVAPGIGTVGGAISGAIEGGVAGAGVVGTGGTIAGGLIGYGLGSIVYAAQHAADPAPNFVVAPDGTAVPVPEGATGPTPTRAPGVQFTGGSGGNGFDPRVAGVRIMDANSNQGARAVYMNQTGQTVNPYTGRTLQGSDPSAHFYFGP